MLLRQILYTYHKRYSRSQMTYRLSWENIGNIEEIMTKNDKFHITKHV